MRFKHLFFLEKRNLREFLHLGSASCSRKLLLFIRISSIAHVMAGILTGKIMGTIGRKLIMIIGFSFAAVSMSGFCFGHYWLEGDMYLYLFLGS